MKEYQAFECEYCKKLIKTTAPHLQVGGYIKQVNVGYRQTEKFAINVKPSTAEVLTLCDVGCLTGLINQQLDMP